MDDALDQLHPMPGLTGQQFFMLQVLLVQGRMGEVPLVPGMVLFSHFQGMEDMNFRAGHVDGVRQRGDEIGIDLVFAAFFRNIRSCAAEHIQKRRAALHLPAAPVHPLLNRAAFEGSVVNQRIQKRQQDRCLQLCRNDRRLIEVRASENAVVDVNVNQRPSSRRRFTTLRTFFEVSVTGISLLKPLWLQRGKAGSPDQSKRKRIDTRQKLFQMARAVCNNGGAVSFLAAHRAAEHPGISDDLCLVFHRPERLRVVGFEIAR